MLAGCAMCCSPFDYSYPTYGGKWQRVDREHGRVASVFTPEAGVRVEEGLAADETMIEGEIIDGEIIEGEVIEGDMAEMFQDAGESVESVRLMKPVR